MTFPALVVKYRKRENYPNQSVDPCRCRAHKPLKPKR